MSVCMFHPWNYLWIPIKVGIGINSKSFCTYLVLMHTSQL